MSEPTENTRLLISMHMEKCGGTSLHRLLRAEFGDGFYLYDPGPPESRRKPDFPTATRCVHGHMFFGLHEYFPQRVCHYITLLRDPIDRFLSNYEHICNHEHPLHQMVTGEAGLEHFCSESDARHYRNLFVRRLAGVRDDIEKADLERAEQNLRTFAVVGVLKNADAFTRACVDRFGWRSGQMEHSNHAPGGRRKISDYSEADQQRVLDANDWDLQLMQRVEDLLAG